MNAQRLTTGEPLDTIEVAAARLRWDPSCLLFG
jgi:hypothetical protein